MPGRMSRGVEHPEFLLRKPDDVPFFKKHVGGRRFWYAETEHGRLPGSVPHPVGIPLVDADARAGFLLQEADRSHVIEVTVGDQDFFQVPPPLLQQPEDFLPVLPRVHNDGAAAGRVSHEIGVLREGPYLQYEDTQGKGFAQTCLLHVWNRSV